MAIDLASDLTEMLSEDDFGTTATYNSAPVFGIFTEEYYEQEIGTAGASTSEPVFYGKTAEMVGIAEGETLTIGVKDFLIAHFEADGDGLTRVVLND